MLAGKKVCLRSLELSDLDAIMEDWNFLEMRQNTGNALPRSRKEMEDFIKRSWKFREGGKGYIFAIIEQTTQAFLGHCSLFILNAISRSANLGIFIYRKDNWSKGFGTDAMKVLLDYGFSFLNLHRIELGVYPSNERAIYVYKKLGFKEVGRKRSCRFMAGEYRDEILMDILETEWRAPSE